MINANRFILLCLLLFGCGGDKETSSPMLSNSDASVSMDASVLAQDAGVRADAKMPDASEARDAGTDAGLDMDASVTPDASSELDAGTDAGPPENSYIQVTPPGSSVVLPEIGTIFSSTSFTVEAWFSADNRSSIHQMVISNQGDSNQRRGFEMGLFPLVSGGGPYCTVGTGSEWVRINDRDAQESIFNGWHHIACSYYNGELYLHVDGELRVRRNCPTFYSALEASPMYLTRGDFSGKFDELRISNQAIYMPDQRFGPSRRLTADQTTSFLVTFDDASPNSTIDLISGDVLTFEGSIQKILGL